MAAPLCTLNKAKKIIKTSVPAFQLLSGPQASYSNLIAWEVHACAVLKSLGFQILAFHLFKAKKKKKKECKGIQYQPGFSEEIKPSI